MDYKTQQELHNRFTTETGIKFSNGTRWKYETWLEEQVVKLFAIPVVRVRFYLTDYDVDLEKEMPFRLNTGDDIFIDSIVDIEDEKLFTPEKLQHLYDVGNIQECYSIIIDADKKGIYQNVYCKINA